MRFSSEREGGGNRQGAPAEHLCTGVTPLGEARTGVFRGTGKISFTEREEIATQKENSREMTSREGPDKNITVGTGGGGTPS